jgi:DNA-binding YbaB/EbfC family protein
MDKEIEDLLAGIDVQHERVMRIQRTVERMEITGYAGNGEVTVKLRGTAELTEVYLDPQLLRRSDPETVGQLVVQAVNDGMRRLNEVSRREFEPIIAEATGSF